MEIRGEVETADFGDKRLSRRLVRLAEQLARAPDCSFPKAAGSDSALEATYRFLGNDAVSPAAILAPHVRATVARCAQVGTVIVAHDTTELRFSTEREDVGRLKAEHTYGFLGHFALAMAPSSRAPLGVLGMDAVFRRHGQRYGKHRERSPLQEKESRRWLDLVRRADIDLGEATVAIHVMDREADAYELLAACVVEQR